MDLFGNKEAQGLPLDGSQPALRPCRYCGNGTGYLTDPVPPHSNGVRCMDCKRHLGWLRTQHDDVTLVED